MFTVLHRVHRVGALTALLAIGAIGASCRAATEKTQTASAKGEWSRTLPLEAGAKVEILNPVGNVTVDTGPEPTVEIHAERVAYAMNEKVARDFLPHVSIKADSAPGLLTVQPEPIPGVFMGVHFEINYHVRIPSSAPLHVRTGNGDITITGAGGHVSVTDSNGNIIGRLLARGIDARNTNGRIDVEIASPSDDSIDMRAVNGSISLTLPPAMNANLSATAVNGTATVTGLEFEPFGGGDSSDATIVAGRRRGGPIPRGDRRLRGRINAGGAPIELNTVNGEIRVRAHE